MRGGPVFLGVYAKAVDLERNGEKHATRWHVWGLSDGGFMLQEAPAKEGAERDGKNEQAPAGEPKRLSPDEFLLEYRVLAAFSPQKKSRKPEPETPATPVVPVVEDYTRGGRGQTASGNAPKAETTAKKQPGYNNLWARQDEPAPAQPKSIGPEPRAWAPSAAEEDAGITIVKGRRPADETVHPISWNLPEPETKTPARFKREVIKHSGLSVSQAHQVETLDDSDGPVDMPRAEIERIEEDFRTEFSLALIRLKGKRDEGIAALEKMARQPGPFALEHKFMFTDCGLALRKRNFYSLANKFHERARKLSPDDEHVLFNQARVMYESGRIDKARAFLQLALDMVPGFGAAKDFLAFIEGPNKR